MDSALYELFKSDGIVGSVAEAITSIGVIGVFLPASVAVAVVLWRLSRSVALSVVPPAATWATALVTAYAKDLFGRARPAGAEALGVVSAAFPSGHASNTTAFALATALALGAARPLWRRRAIWTAVGVSFVMGWTRLALGVHWTTDVLAGWALGAAVAVSVFRVAQLMPLR